MSPPSVNKSPGQLVDLSVLKLGVVASGALFVIASSRLELEFDRFSRASWIATQGSDPQCVTTFTLKQIPHGVYEHSELAHVVWHVL